MTAHAQRAPGTGRRPGAHPSRHTAAPPVTLMGELTGTRFKNADNGFFIGTLKTDGEEGKPESTPIVGTSPAGIPRLGAFLALDGAWVEDPKYGRQFRFSALREEVPPSTDGMATYLAKYTGGIGEKRARSIIERFGADAFQIITDHPERLIGIAGITGDLAVQIQAAFQAAAADREALTTLHGWEIGPAGINAIKDAWEGDLLAAVHAIKVNPYLLSKHVAGFGFIRSDRVALKAGVPLNSPFRHAAAILHCLEEAASDGHTWLSRLRIVKGWRGFKDAKCGLLNLLGSDPGGDAISLALSELVRDGSVEALALGYALPRLVQAEQAIAEKVRALMKQGEKPSRTGRWMPMRRCTPTAKGWW